MKPNITRMSTGPDARASLGIIATAKFYPYPAGTNAGQPLLNGLNFTEELEALRTQAIQRGAAAVTGVSFQVNNLPGGVYVIATGTLSEA